MPTLAHVSPFAGTWYPGSSAALHDLITRLFETSSIRTDPALLPRPLAFVVPHAGLAYSGTVAAAAYSYLRDAAPSRVFVLGFLHDGSRPEISIPDADAFDTPIGRTTVDRTTIRSLAEAPPFHLTPASSACDHSVEIQLPLLQTAIPGTPIVPLYVAPLSPAGRDTAARRLASLIGPGDILIASTDLTHYGRNFGYKPFPVDDLTPENLRSLDQGLIAAAGSLDADLFLSELRQTESTLCGFAPVSLLLRTLQLLGGEEIFQQTLDYQTSGEITGDYSHSVSYGAVGYFRASSFELSEPQREALLASAYETLRRLRETGQSEPAIPPEHDPALDRRAAAFVSLHHDHELLGCIGRISADVPLYEAVPRLALSAALHDPRFRRTGPLPEDVNVEVSLLTPMKRTRDAQSFQLGGHGAYLESGINRGLLLPQVAADRPGCTTEWFLDALAHKAGLPSRAWRDSSARLSVFRAQVF